MLKEIDLNIYLFGVFIVDFLEDEEEEICFKLICEM